MGPRGVGGALRGPSPGDKGPAAPPSPGAALWARGRPRRLPGPPDPAGPAGAAGPCTARGGLFPGALSPSSRGGGSGSRGGGGGGSGSGSRSSSSSGSGRLSLRLPLRESPRRGGREAPGRRGRDRRRGRHLAPRGRQRRGHRNAPGRRRDGSQGRVPRVGRGRGTVGCPLVKSAHGAWSPAYRGVLGGARGRSLASSGEGGARDPGAGPRDGRVEQGRE